MLSITRLKTVLVNLMACSQLACGKHTCEGASGHVSDAVQITSCFHNAYYQFLYAQVVVSSKLALLRWTVVGNFYVSAKKAGLHRPNRYNKADDVSFLCIQTS